MRIALIYAQNEEGAIGYRGDHPMPWHHPEDFDRFKVLTMGHPVVMGKDTFNSLPHLLPGRFHYVLTSGRGMARLGRLDNIQFMNNMDDVIADLTERNIPAMTIIGGSDLINRYIGKADVIYRTIVLNTPLVGNLARVLRPEDGDPVWDDYTRTETETVDNRLVFETYEKLT